MSTIKPLTPEDRAALIRRLGKQSDISLGKQYGRSRETIKEMRRVRRIPPCEREFRDNNKVVATTTLTKEDGRRVNQAMKKTGDNTRAKYIRRAVRDKNEEVLG